MADPAGVWRRRRRIHGGLWWRSHDSPRPDVSGTSPSLVASNSLFGTFGNLSGATVTHALKRRIKYSLGLKLGLVSIPGTALGALLAQHAESDLFKILLGSILAVSAYMLFRGKMKGGGATDPHGSCQS